MHSTTDRQSSFAYLGWSGRGNLGDDAIEVALASALPGRKLLRLPLYRHEIRKEILTLRFRQFLGATPLLGGGTVLGRTRWREHLTKSFRFARKRPAFMIGAGVEDPTLNDNDSQDELRHWPKLLREFDRITVRGPRSQALMGDLGFEAEVVGDPALLLSRPEFSEQPREDTIGVNIGWGGRLWGDTHQPVIEAVAATVRHWIDRGRRIRFFIAYEANRAETMSCVRLVDRPASSIEIINAVNTDDYLRSVSACQLLIGEKLHAVVLAAAMNVPHVMLEYQPKCADFMASIDRSDWCVRTDRVSASKLIDMTTHILDSHDEQAEEITRAVGILRLRLSDEIEHISRMT